MISSFFLLDALPSLTIKLDDHMINSTKGEMRDEMVDCGRYEMVSCKNER